MAPPSTNVQESAALLLNDWVAALDLQLGRSCHPGHPPVLYVRASVPMTRYIEGHMKKRVCDVSALLPVTDDMHDILALVGFDKPGDVMDQMRCQGATQRATCSLMCGSRLFSPAMVKSTNYHKLGGLSPLAEYVRESYVGGTGSMGQDGNASLIGRARTEVHAAISQRFPHVQLLRDAAMEQARVLGAVKAATWGRGLEDIIDDREADLSVAHDRWLTFVTLQGVLPLSRMAPKDAYALWAQFRDDPLAHPHDWSLLQHVSATRS